MEDRAAAGSDVEASSRRPPRVGRRPPYRLLRTLGALGGLALAIWLPRAFALDRFVTVDEPSWLTFSGNFYHALAHRDYKHTYQIEHPGVTTTWIGTAALWWRYPAYADDAPGQVNWVEEEIGPFLSAHGHDPVDLLSSARAVMVLTITTVLTLAAAAARRLVGLGATVLGFALIAADPFHIALSRVLHVDALAGSLMLLSILAAMNFLYAGHRLADLLVSAVAAGLAWLTKAPTLFLVPFVGALVLHQALSGAVVGDRWGKLQWAARTLLLWGSVGFLVFVLVWPAMWVDPVRSLGTVVGQAIGHARAGHREAPLFFDGAIVHDPGIRFYPVTYLWRTTPIVLLGLVLAVVLFVAPKAAGARPSWRRAAAVLTLFALLFTGVMTVGAKKFDRYLLPVYPALDLVAAMGLLAAAGWLGTRAFRRPRVMAGAFVGAAMAGQVAFMLPAFPYYFSYYNPLLGGPREAPEVMMVGWGEGLDQAARYLNTQSRSEQLRVVPWVWNATFSYFFKGRILPSQFAPDSASLRQWRQTDYHVLYINQRQRGRLPPALVAYLDSLVPAMTVRIQGLEYVHVYDLRGAPVPAYLKAGGTSGSTE